MCEYLQLLGCDHMTNQKDCTKRILSAFIFSMALEEKKRRRVAERYKACWCSFWYLRHSVFQNLHFMGFEIFFEVLPNKISQNSFENKKLTILQRAEPGKWKRNSSELNHSTSDFLLSSVTNAVSAFPPSFIYQVYIVPSYALLRLLNVIVLWWKSAGTVY